MIGKFIRGYSYEAGRFNIDLNEVEVNIYSLVRGDSYFVEFKEFLHG